MASRWRALHRRKARKFQPTCDPWQPSGWESIYSRDYDDDDYDYDPDYDDESDGDCFHCGGDGYIDGYEDDPMWFEPGEMERCSSCNGSGRAIDMTIW